MFVWRRFSISCAHWLPDHPKCGVMHGHNYTIELGIEGHVGVDGMIVDFSEVKSKLIQPIVEAWDHKILNTVIEVIPTAENMAILLGKEVGYKLQTLFDEQLTLRCVRIYETDDCWVELWF